MTEWADRTAREAGIPQGPYSRRFPSADELKELSASIEKVAKHIGIKKISMPFLHGVIKHIDRDYPKLGVQDFVAKLVRKIRALPVPISTQLVKALAECKREDTAKRAALIKVQALLKSRDWEPAAKDEEWRSLYPELMEFTSPGFKQIVQKAKPSTMKDLDFAECKVAFQGVLGFAAFHDLQRQHLVWMLDYEPKVVPVARWIYDLQNDEWHRELLTILHGSAAFSVYFEKQQKRFLASKRKRRWRNKEESTSKTVDKTQVKSPKPYKKRGHGR